MYAKKCSLQQKIRNTECSLALRVILIMAHIPADGKISSLEHAEKEENQDHKAVSTP